jgi:PAS domain S-box-containing protein
MRVSLKALFSINPASLTVGTILVVVMLFSWGTPLLDSIELKTYDLRFLSRGPVPPSPAVVLALIDEKSLDTEGHWPWPRSKIAALVDILSAQGARVIGFDIGFPEPDENSRLTALHELSQKIAASGIQDPQLADLMRQSQQDTDNDRLLANAIKRSSAAVVLGYFFHMRKADLGYPIEPSDIAHRLKLLSASKYPLSPDLGPDPGVVPWLQAYAPESNLDMFTDAAASSGHVGLRHDADGVVRWAPLIIQAGDNPFPPLALLCAWHYLGKPLLAVSGGPYGVDGIHMGKRFIPTDEAGQLLINYLGPPKTFPYYSVSDILHGKVADGTFTDKIVLVGSSALGLQDLWPTPFSPLYPGVEIHATLIDNILTQRFLTKPQWSKVYDLFAIIALAGLIGIALPRLGVLKGLLCALGLIVLHIFVARWLFVQAGVWLAIVYPLLALSTNSLGLSFSSMTRQLRQAFRDLQASERKFRSVFEDSNDAIFIMTPGGELTDMNPAGLQLFDLGQEVLPALRMQELYVNADDWHRFRQQLEQQTAVSDFEVQLQKRHGSPFDALITATLRHDALGAAAGYQGIIRDITLHKQHERLRAENLRLGAELDVVRRIQMMVLPTAGELQDITQLDIAGYMEPADEVGGDYYDVLQHNGHIKIGVGDVTGHGLESGMLMLMTQMGVRTLLTHEETDPVRFIDVLNRTVYDNVQRMKIDKSLTLVLLDYTPRPDGGGLLSVSGQHEELLVMRRGGTMERVDTLDLGFPIGLEDTIADFVAQQSIALEPGDGVVLYTDGITEAENPQGEQYGLERLCEVLEQHWHASAEAIIEAAISDLRHYIDVQAVLDDITLVVIKQK